MANVDDSRALNAGAGLTGGGDLTADRTFNVAATDGSIAVSADGIAVGVATRLQPAIELAMVHQQGAFAVGRHQPA